MLVAITVDFKKKKSQREICELSFIWGNLSNEAQETASQITQKNCSKEVGGEGQYIGGFVKGRVHEIKHIFVVESSCWSHEASASHEKKSSP